MSHKTITPFESFILSEEESKSAMSLSQLQMQNMHNLRTEYLLQKVGLSIDTKDMTSHIQTEAYLRGQIDVLTYLLEMSQVVQTTQNDQNELGE